MPKLSSSRSCKSRRVQTDQSDHYARRTWSSDSTTLLPPWVVNALLLTGFNGSWKRKTIAADGALQSLHSGPDISEFAF
jgi:hypothetical protein